MVPDENAQTLTIAEMTTRDSSGEPLLVAATSSSDSSGSEEENMVATGDGGGGRQQLSRQQARRTSSSRELAEDGGRELTVLVGKSDSSWGRGSRAAPVPPDAAAAPDAQRCALLREKIVAPFSLRHGTIVFGTCSVYT